MPGSSPDHPQGKLKNPGRCAFINNEHSGGHREKKDICTQVPALALDPSSDPIEMPHKTFLCVCECFCCTSKYSRIVVLNEHACGVVNTRTRFRWPTNHRGAVLSLRLRQLSAFVASPMCRGLMLCWTTLDPLHSCVNGCKACIGQMIRAWLIVAHKRPRSAYGGCVHCCGTYDAQRAKPGNMFFGANACSARQCCNAGGRVCASTCTSIKGEHSCAGG